MAAAASTSDNAPRETAALPALRPEVRVERTAAGLCLHDPAQRFRAALDEDVGALATLLDGARTAADLAAALAARGSGAGLAAIEAALATLDGMFLLDNERGRARARAVREEAAREAAQAAGPSGARLSVLAGDRFDCHACGYCCSNGQSFGPITEADRARASAHDWASEIPGVSGPADLFHEVPDGPGPEEAGGAPPRGKIFLVQRGGRCVFLDEDGLCRIHKRLGYEAKPFMCRAFPFAFARTPEGPVALTRRECRSLERSRRTGTPLERRRASLEALAAEDPEPVVADALVPFCGPVTVPYRLARAIRAAALHALEAPAEAADGRGDALERLLSVRDLVAGVSARLGERPGEAELAAALAFAEGRALGPSPSPAPVPDALARDARQAFASLAQELADNVMKAGLYLRFEAPDTGAVRREEQDAAGVALLELLALLKPGLARPVGPVPPFAAAARRARIDLDARDGAPAGEVLRDAMRQEVHGWAVLSRAPLLFGYALLALRAVIALGHARRCAGARGARAVSNEDMHRGVLLAARSLGGAANERIALRDPRRILTFFRGLRFGDPL